MSSLVGNMICTMKFITEEIFEQPSKKPSLGRVKRLGVKVNGTATESFEAQKIEKKKKKTLQKNYNSKSF